MLGKWILKRQCFRNSISCSLLNSNFAKTHIRWFSRVKSTDDFISKEERMKRVEEATKNATEESNLHKIKYKTRQVPTSEYDNNTPVKSYRSMFKDNLFKTVAFWGISFLLCMMFSKRVMERILIKKWNPDKDNEFLENVKPINPIDVKFYKRGFAKGKRHFVQVVRSKEESKEYKSAMDKLSKGLGLTREEKFIIQEELETQKIHPHYFELKRI